MHCAVCSTKLEVITTRSGADEVTRMRRCPSCGRAFYTIEKYADERIARPLLNCYERESRERRLAARRE